MYVTANKKAITLSHNVTVYSRLFNVNVPKVPEGALSVSTKLYAYTSSPSEKSLRDAFNYDVHQLLYEPTYSLMRRPTPRCLLSNTRM